MKVAYVVGTTTGGTGTHVAMLARGFADRGVAVRVFGPARTGRRFFPAGAPPAGPAGRAVTEGQPGFVVVDISDRPRPGHDLAVVLRLRRLLRAWAPDVVHAHGLRAGALTAVALTTVALTGPARSAGPPGSRAGDGGAGDGGAGDGGAGDGGVRGGGVRGGGVRTGRAATRRRPALVVTVHNAPPSGATSRLVYTVLERIAARRADAVTWVSADLATRMRRVGARDGGRALVPAPDAAPLSAEQIAAERASLGGTDRPIVLAAGRMVAQKGYPVLLAAAARWQDRDPVPLLVIAGEGPLAEPLAAQARDTGVATRFLGQRSDIPALLAAADVVVVPSRWEGQPLIVQEALRAGRPLVASRTGGIPDVTGEDAALLVPPGDPTALAAAVASVLDDPGLAAKLAAAAAQRAGELPDADDAVDAVAHLYHRLLR
jgi:glycosyltransferase involved in cell wall biosynthesis